MMMDTNVDRSSARWTRESGGGGDENDAME
jgi:hypothetical protein